MVSMANLWWTSGPWGIEFDSQGLDYKVPRTIVVVESKYEFGLYYFKNISIVACHFLSYLIFILMKNVSCTWILTGYSMLRNRWEEEITMKKYRSKKLEKSVCVVTANIGNLTLDDMYNVCVYLNNVKRFWF